MLTLMDKDAVAELVGKRGWTPTVLAGKLYYASGIPDLDAKRDPGKWLDIPIMVNIAIRDRGIVIDGLIGFKTFATAATFDQIGDVAVETTEAVVEKKEKSVIGRALVGGLLLGPVGAIVGGMTGIGTKEKPGKMPDAFVTITVDGEPVVFTCAGKHAAEVEMFLRKIPRP